MRIISLVPSWTETLIESGIYPVGRTRFCIHPHDAIQNIPIVGGTKSADWQKIAELKPDLLILDQEENPKEFSEKKIPFYASHVTNGNSLAKALGELAKILGNQNLSDLQKLSEKINGVPTPQTPVLKNFLIESLTPWEQGDEIAYMIWKNPWMSVAPETYIGFVLQKLGFRLHNWKSPQKYPEVELDPQLYHLFSSEPFPFLKYKSELQELKIKGAIVDGEKISWFGIRSLEFLRKSLELEVP